MLDCGLEHAHAGPHFDPAAAVFWMKPEEALQVVYLVNQLLPEISERA